MAFFKRRVTVSEASKLLLGFHAGIFNDKALRELAELNQIGFKSQADYARALWEWLCFGLYTVVTGIQSNSRNNDRVGMAIAQSMYAEFYSGLNQAGLPAVELPVMEKQIHQRFEEYNAVVRTSSPERLGFAVAARVLGDDLGSGELPRSPETFGFGLGVNNFHIGGLEAVNKFFDEYKVSG